MTAFVPLNPNFAARVRDSFARQPMMTHLGATLAAIEPGFCEIHLPWRRALTQQHGYIHGGALAAIVDSAAGYAAFSLMPADAAVLTVEYKLNLIAPADGELLIARGRVVKPGRTLTVAQFEVAAVKSGTERVTATALQTLMCLAGRPDTPALRG